MPGTLFKSPWGPLYMVWTSEQEDVLRKLGCVREAFQHIVPGEEYPTAVLDAQQGTTPAGPPAFPVNAAVHAETHHPAAATESAPEMTAMTWEGAGQQHGASAEPVQAFTVQEGHNRSSGTGMGRATLPLYCPQGLDTPESIVGACEVGGYNNVMGAYPGMLSNSLRERKMLWAHHPPADVAKVNNQINRLLNKYVYIKTRGVEECSYNAAPNLWRKDGGALHQDNLLQAAYTTNAESAKIEGASDVTALGFELYRKAVGQQGEPRRT